MGRSLHFPQLIKVAVINIFTNIYWTLLTFINIFSILIQLQGQTCHITMQNDSLTY